MKPTASPLALVLVIGLFLSACGGGSDGSAATPTAPSGPSGGGAPGACAVSVSGIPGVVPGAGGNFSASVAAGSTCAWTAQSDAVWASLTPSSGVGNGSLVLTVQENTSVTNSRAANLTIGGQTLRVSQANACTYTLDQTSANVSSDGGNFGIRIISPNGCPWTARGSESWLTVRPTTGEGSDLVNVDVAPNTGGTRTATVTIASLRVQVTQEGR